MPRERRIEYPGAIYHAMARGNRRGDIVRDDRDRSRFVETLEEAVEASGWVLYGWVLMSNHYHFLFQTPEPNLVQGMSWFQNTWTRRFNTRHRLWGHLFGGRYPPSHKATAGQARPNRLRKASTCLGSLPTFISIRCAPAW